jgi:phage gpG-like protein
MTDSGVDSARLDARWTTIKTTLASAVEDKIAALGAELQARIEAKLSGDVLAKKSGALLASLALEPEADADGVFMRIGSHGVPYAAIQEFGGKTAAHDIVAVKAKALAFIADGRKILAAHVHHPGSMIPPHSFMRSALDEMHGEIVGALKAVVTKTIRAS